MAETKVIEIRTLEAIQNVRDLKDNIAALKAKIDDVDTATEEYSDLTKQLSQNQAALRNVMNGTNSTFETSIQDAQGLSTSYNSLVQQLKEATQEWRALPKYLSDADKAAGKVSDAWQVAAQKVFNLRAELKSMDADTNSFVRNVGNYKSALEGLGGAMGQVKQVGGDMVNGISAAASSLAILGVNTEGLDNSMKNLRVMLAAVQGAKGFAGMVNGLRNYFNAGRQAVQVTSQQAAATATLATATEAEAAATTHAATAMDVLKTALVSTGIGALIVGLGMLVAHFEDIVKWVGKVGEKFGLWKKQTNDVKDANKNLTEKLEKQNHALDNQQKLLSAQGTSNKTLLIQKQNLINAQISETKVTIENVKARIRQIEADARWWKFWQGTKGKLKEANAELEELNSTLKALEQSAEDIKIDIQVEGIKEGNKAAEKAKKDLEKALETAKKLVDDGVKAANKELHAQETELQTIDREYKDQVDTINKAIEATKKLTGQTENLSVLQNGLVAAEKNRNKAVQEFYKKKYDAEATKNAAQITNQYNLQYKELEKVEAIRKNVLNLGDKNLKPLRLVTAEQQKQYEILKASVEILRKDIPFAIEDMPDLEFKTDEELVSEFLEPTATAIRLYFTKNRELEQAGLGILQSITEGYEDAIANANENGLFKTAELLAYELSQNLKNALGVSFDDLKSIFTPIGQAYNEYILDMYKGIEQKKKDGSYPSLLEPLFGFDRDGLNELRILKEMLSQYEEGTDEFIMLNEKATKQSRKLWDDYFTMLEKHFSLYGKATSNIMDSVADAWEAALQAQVKNGKKSEEEAKASFENVKHLQMAAAVINTAGAVVQALSDPAVPTYYLRAINAAAALAAGTAQVLKISMTEFNSNASNTSAGMSAPTPVDRTPQINYTVGLNTQDYAQAAAQNPVRAYVVDKDLSDGLDEYNRRQNETTF